MLRICFSASKVCQISRCSKFSGAFRTSTRTLSIFQWIRRLRFPTSSQLYNRDGLDRLRYRMVYRTDFNRGVIWLAPVLSLIPVPFFIKGLVKNALYSNDGQVELDDEDFELLYNCAGLLAIAFSAFLIRLLHRYVLRIYFDPRTKSFLLVTGHILKPWSTSKHVCQPGSAKLTSVGNDIRGTTIINRKRWYIAKDEFFYPMYYNVLYGYEHPSVLDSHTDAEDADRVFRMRKAMDD